MEKLKVLQVIPSFGVGGAEKLVLDYLTYFDKEKVDIKAISMYGNKNTIYDDFIRDKGLNVVYLDKKPGVDLSMVLKMKKIIKEFKPDIIHSHMNSMKYIIYSVINNKQVKMFHTLHNEPEKDAKGLDKYFNKFSFKYLNCIPIALTDELATKVNSYYGLESAIVVNNGINLDKFKNEKEDKKHIRRSLNLPPDSFIVGHVGRFMGQKNHEFIIDVFKKVVNVKKDSLLILVGEGELKRDIEEKVIALGLSDKVKFLGLRKDIPELLKSFDAFLFPSFHEGYPITLIEAQAAGVRCVISNSIDSRCVLSNDTISVSLEATPEEWCDVIIDENIKGTPTDTIESFDIKGVVKQLEKLYRIELEK
ncbi:glycosyltransferase [Aquibacillus salsiterrae]|uniref:Glycosyltransferase n=1 Tax=Aquibacillus salsiterrae TaxID=2950439 RepID=A0A9X3WDS0_9BACI|nr:glycosyltransferase [Aquibacillus salsiterrae]MDC3416601.1 glycosyltransferase [Aquibacillus salsiterrae]